MRYYFGENGWPKSKLGGSPETDSEKDQLIDSLQVEWFDLEGRRLIPRLLALASLILSKSTRLT